MQSLLLISCQTKNQQMLFVFLLIVVQSYGIIAANGWKLFLSKGLTLDFIGRWC